MNENQNNQTAAVTLTLGEKLRKAAELSDIIEVQKADIASRQAELDKNQAALAELTGNVVKPTKRVLSLESRQKIADGRRAAWAKLRANNQGTKEVVGAVQTEVVA